MADVYVLTREQLGKLLGEAYRREFDDSGYPYGWHDGPSEDEVVGSVLRTAPAVATLLLMLTTTEVENVVRESFVDGFKTGEHQARVDLYKESIRRCVKRVLARCANPTTKIVNV